MTADIIDSKPGRKWIANADVKHPIRVMSYNLLAPTLVSANAYLYETIANSNLKWTIRRRKITSLIKEIAPCDIYCFQEVEFQEHSQLAKNVLASNNFYNVYQKRTSKTTMDGCSLFVCKKRFSTVTFKKLLYTSEKGEDNKHNVALISLLRCKITQKYYLIATTHLLWNPKRGDIKLQQLAKLFNTIDDMLHRNRAIDTHIIIAGDFNMLPHSLLHEYVAHGNVKPEISDLYWSGQIPTPVNAELFATKSASHFFDLRSVNAPYTTSQGHPYSTTCHSKANQLVDYIFHGTYSGIASETVCSGFMEPLSEFEINKMPNEVEGSDHIYLLAEFGSKVL